MLGVLDQHAFGDFQFKPIGAQPGVLGNLVHLLGELVGSGAPAITSEQQSWP